MVQISNSIESLEEIEKDLAGYLSSTFQIKDFKDRYLAMSVLQKAIRRGHTELALSSGHYLWSISPKTVWNRLQITALEDVGLADIQTVWRVLKLANEPTPQGVVHDPFYVASYLIEALCNSRKDRSADDLFDVISRDKDCAINCTEMSKLKNPDEQETFMACRRALSLVPTSQRDLHLDGRLRRIAEWVSKLNEVSEFATADVLPVAIKATKQTRSILAPMLVALCPEYPVSPPTQDDRLLPVEWVQGIPTWACGQHTRVGLTGLRIFARESAEASRLLKSGKTGEVSSSKVLGALLFRIECGQLKKRVDWGVGRDLKERATLLGWGLRDEYVPELLDVMLAEWDLLNACRVSALENYLR